MTENKKYCMGCMKEIDEGATVCPHCYYKADSLQHPPCLPKESVLAERYLVGKAISMANDSITYIGLDLQTQEIVSLHEFFPVKIAGRTGDGVRVTIRLGCEEIFRNCLQSFINLWRGIGSVEGEKALPTVRNILDYNGTVYAVCQYIDSITLKAYFDEIRKPLTWQKANSAFKGILTGLSALHKKGIVHGNITPASVQVGSDGKLHLTYFTIAECHSRIDSLNMAPVNGFSAIELYGEERSATATSDVYSVCALLYYSITGIVPSKATERAVKDTMVIPSAVAATLPKRAISAFVKGLAVHRENRIQTVDELMAMILPAAPRKTTVTPQPADKKTAEKAAAQKGTAADKKQSSSKGKKTSDTSLITLGVGTFFAVVVICTFIFSALYATVLYKNYDIPVLNNMLSSISFLPMNSNQPEPELPTESSTTAYQAQENSYVTVPDFTAHTYDSITANTTFINNFDIKFTFEYSEELPKNAVISQDLVKGESVMSGTTVNIVVSKGAEQIELVEVFGLSYEDAKAELEGLGFKVTKQLIENDGSHEGGIVEMMDKVAGLEFDRGTEIILSVWDEAPEQETEEEAKEHKEEKSDEEE